MVCRLKGRMWQVIGVLLILLMGIALCRPIEAVVYEVSPPEFSSGLIGSTVDVPINIESIEGVEVWLIYVDFNPTVVTFESIVNSTFTNYYQVEDNLQDIDATKRRVTVGAYLKQEYLADLWNLPAESGALFSIEFSVNGPGPGATDIDVSIVPDSGAASDAPELVAGPDGVFYAQTVKYEITMEHVSVTTKGKTISVPVFINNVQDLQAWSMDVQYKSSILDFIGIRETALSDIYDYLEINEDTPGTLRIAGISQDAPSGGSGQFLVLRFDTKKAGSTSITLTFPVDKGNQLGAVASSSVVAEVKSPVSYYPYWNFFPSSLANFYIRTSMSSFPPIPIAYPQFPAVAPQLFSVYPYSRLSAPWGRSIYYPTYPAYGFGGNYPFYYMYR